MTFEGSVAKKVKKNAENGERTFNIQTYHDLSELLTNIRCFISIVIITTLKKVDYMALKPAIMLLKENTTQHLTVETVAQTASQYNKI